MQNIWPVIGHGKIIDFLQNSVKKDKIAHAYLFYGPNKVGKFRVSLEFAKTLECENKNLKEECAPCNKCQTCLKIEKMNHPDVLAVKAEEVTKGKKRYEKKIGIEEVQKIQHHLSLFTHSAPYKIVIVDGAEKLSREASNAFLKTLEDPTDKSVIILITDSIGEILPTISSRTQMIKFLSVPAGELLKNSDILKNRIKNEAVKISEIINFSSGKPGLLIDIANDTSVYSQKQKSMEKIAGLIDADIGARCDCATLVSEDANTAKEAIGDCLLFFRELLLFKKNCGKYSIFKSKSELFKKYSLRYTVSQLNYLLRRIAETQRMISNNSFNAKLILEVLFLEI